MSRLTRREVIKGSLALGGAMLLPAGRSYGRPLGANERIRVAVAGVNGRGGSHLGAFAKKEGTQVIYIVDPDSRLFESRCADVEKRSDHRPKTAQDIRKVLDDKDVDVVSIATPNHWHSLMTVWACQAGKDVYVEKPLSHNIHEGRIAVEAARKYGRIVQHGTQSRSDGKYAKIAAVVASGKLGKLLVARGLCYKTRNSIGEKPVKTPPSELDYNIWLGPAPELPYHENLVHYNWHWFWPTGNGDIGNQGVHQMDLARWAIPGATLPKSVISLGGRFGYKDQATTPNTQIAVFDYGETQLIFEVRGLKTDKYMGQTVGNTFHMEGGTIIGDKFFPKGQDKSEPLPDVEYSRGPGGGDHFQNFIAAVRSRKQSDLNADILEGHYSSALCHLANASYRLGEQVSFDKGREPFGNNEAGNEAFARMCEHLEANKIDLSQIQYQMGKRLLVDAASEKVTNESAANEILTGSYRAPFIVPEKLA